MAPAPKNPKADRYHGVEPTLVAKCQRITDAMACLLFAVVPVQGVRTADYQHALYEQGRTKPGPIVTNADGFTKLSNHQAKPDGFGHAVDFAFVDQNGDPSFDGHWPWALLGAMAEAQGLVWGGRFSSPVDLGHVELPVTHVPTKTA